MWSDKKYVYRTLPYSGKVAGSTYSNNVNTPSITLTVNNIVVAGNKRDNVIAVQPYGRCANPNINATAVIFNSGIMGQSPNCMGYISPPPANAPSLGNGEFYDCSNGWLIKYGNSAVQAYLLSNPNYIMTLPAGEWLGKFLTDILTRLNQIETLYNLHVHTGVTTGVGSSGPPATLMPIDPDLIADQTYIDSGNYLLGPDAEPLPSGEDDE